MAETKPVKVAVLLNSLPPYRAQVHRRIVREMADVRLYTVLTHEEDGRWSLAPEPELNVVNFGPGESCWAQNWTRRPAHEFRKGGRIIEWIRREGISAVVCSGYNDVGRLRILRWCHRHGVPIFVAGDSNIRDDATRGVKRWLKRRGLGRIMAWGARARPFRGRGVGVFEGGGEGRGRVVFFPVGTGFEL